MKIAACVAAALIAQHWRESRGDLGAWRTPAATERSWHVMEVSMS
jgi:hypothetical protein